MLFRILAILLMFLLLSIGCEKVIDIGDLNSFPPENLNYSCQYYVDADNGSDLNVGTSRDEAWQTIGKVSKTSREIGYFAGETVCFKRGQRFLVIIEGKGGGDLAAGSMGSSSQPVFYGAYGDTTLPLPILTPSVIIEDTADWQDMGGGVYLWPHFDRAWQASGVWEDRAWLREATNKTLSDGEWFYQDSEGLYYKPGNGVVAGHQIHFAQTYGVFGIHQLTNTVFIDLAFEYAGTGLNGSVLKPQNRGPAGGMFNIAVINCTFNNIVIPIEIRSATFEGTVYEAHDLAFIGNTFSDMRYGIYLHNGTNGPEGFYNLLFKNNVLRNLAVDGSYMWPNAIDIEGITMQNVRNVEISNNDIRTGVKSVQPPRDKNNNPLISNGIVIWRHPVSMIRNVIIKNNFISNVGRGISVGADVVDAMRNIVVSNNIITGSEFGLRINGIDSTKKYIVAHNTLYRNDVNAQLSPIGGSVFTGNLSVEPVTYHITIPSRELISIPDYNFYIPDGIFKVVGGSETTLNSLDEWKALGYDINSMSSSVRPFIVENPAESNDFILSNTAPVLDYVTNTFPDVLHDFGNRPRPSNSLSDSGAWERQATDP